MHEIVKLKNGLTLIMESIPFVKSVSFGIFVFNGSRNETKNLNGISHFIEHMMFKGTDKRSAKDIAEEMDMLGGQINAYTSKEYTCYHTRALDIHFDKALEVITDMFFNSSFDTKEIQKEKNVIIEEINMYEDSPEELVHDLLQENIWGEHSLSYPILGTENTIKTFTHDTFKTYINEYYRPDNTVVSVAGFFDINEMIEKITNAFGNWTATAITPAKSNAKYIKNVVSRKKEIEQVHICLGFPSLKTGHDDMYALSIFNTIFGGGMSSRLFQSIREEKGLAYSVYSYTSSFKETGLFTIYAGLNPSQTEEALKSIIDEIYNLNKNKIDEKTLNKTKEQLKSSYIIGLESTSNRMSSMGRNQLRLGRVHTPEEVISKIDEVNLEQIVKVYTQILNLENASLSIVGNITDIDYRRFVNV